MKMLPIVVVLLMGFVGNGSTQTLYKYQDADGHWQFSDQKPVTNRPVETSPLNTKAKASKEATTSSELNASTQPKTIKPLALLKNDFSPRRLRENRENAHDFCVNLESQT